MISDERWRKSTRISACFVDLVSDWFYVPPRGWLTSLSPGGWACRRALLRPAQRLGRGFFDGSAELRPMADYRSQREAGQVPVPALSEKRVFLFCYFASLHWPLDFPHIPTTKDHTDRTAHRKAARSSGSGRQSAARARGSGVWCLRVVP